MHVRTDDPLALVASINALLGLIKAAIQSSFRHARIPEIVEDLINELLDIRQTLQPLSEIQDSNKESLNAELATGLRTFCEEVSPVLVRLTRHASETRLSLISKWMTIEKGLEYDMIVLCTLRQSLDNLLAHRGETAYQIPSLFLKPRRLEHLFTNLGQTDRSLLSSSQIRGSDLEALESAAACQCLCHNVYQVSLPRFLRPIIGNLSGGITGNLRSSCNDPHCIGVGVFNMSLVLVFPTWLLRRSISLSVKSHKVLPWTFSLHLGSRKVVSQHHASFRCISNGDTERLHNFFLTGEISPWHVDANGDSFLHVAAREGQFAMCTYLIDIGLDRYLPNIHNKTPADIDFDRWISSDANLNPNSPFGVDKHVLKKRRFSPLHLAVLGIGRSDVEALLRMGLETHQIDALDVDQRTPLYWSVRKHDVKSTKALLAYGADPGAGVSPIAWACKDPYTGSELLNVLIEAGVDPNSYDGDGHTALHACGIFGRDSQFLHALVSHGAEIDTQYNGPYLQYQGITALGFSALYGQPVTLKGLLQLGAHPTVADSEGRTPIHLAIQSVHKATRVECLNALIDAGADLNLRDKTRRNAANTAMSVQDLDCLQVLMSYGGDLTFPLSSKRGEHGNTPYSVLSWPLLEKQNAVVELLLQRLDLRERDPITGYTVLHAIAKYGTPTALVTFENLLSNLTDVSVYPVDIAQYEVNEQLQEHRRFSLFLHRLAERQQATAENHFGPSNRILGRLVDNQAKDVRSSDIEAEYFNAPIPHGHAHTKIKRDSQQKNTTHVGGLSRTTASVRYSVNHIGEESSESVADSGWTRVNTNLSEDTGFKENHNAVTKSVLSLLIGAGSNALDHSGNDVKLATVEIPGMIPSTAIEEEIVTIQDPDSELLQEGWHDENVFAIDKGYHEDTDSGYASDATYIYNSTRIPRPRTPILDVRQVDTLLRRRCVESRTKAADESMQQDDAGESLRQERREQKTEKRNVKVRSISLGYGTFVMARFMIYTIIAIAWSSLKTTHSAFRRSCQRLMRPKLLKDHARITWICWCGKEVYADFPSATAGAMQMLQDALSNHAPHTTTNTPTPNLQIPSAAHLGNGAYQGIVNSPNNNAVGTSNTVGPHSSVGSPNSTVVPRFLELCINTGKSYQNLGEIDLTRVACDEELFAWVRKRYQEVRGSRRHWTQYLFKPVAMKFVSFGLEHKEKVHIFQQDSYPTAQHVATHTWHYWPCPLEPPLPMPSSAFIHYLSHCNNSTQTTPKTPVWLPRLPKKLDESLLRSSDPLAHAFGLHIIEGLNKSAVLWTLFVVMSLCSGPLLGYIIMTKDVQGVTGIGGLIVGTLTLVWMSATVSTYGEQ